MLTDKFINHCTTAEGLRGMIADENKSKEHAVEIVKEVINALWDSLGMEDILTGLESCLDDEWQSLAGQGCDPIDRAVYEQVRAHITLAKHTY